MISQSDVVAILQKDTKACSIELELFDAMGTTPIDVAAAAGRSFLLESLILPDMDGGSPVISQIVRFQPKGGE